MRLFIGFVAISVIVVEISSELADPSPFFYEQRYEAGISTKRAAGNLRGRKQFDPEEDGFFEDFGLKKGQYNFGEKEYTDFSDIRSNVPGEPGIDYPVYLEIPITTFSCVGRNQGYYADEEAGCQVFHVCDDDQALSFLCPVGSLFSQRLLTCDWWSKVPCSQSRQFYNLQSDLNKIPSKKNHIESRISQKVSNYIGHDRLTDIDSYVQVKDDAAIISTNNGPEKVYSLNIIRPTDKLQDSKIDDVGLNTATKSMSKYKDSPIIRIATLPKDHEYSSLNDQTSRDQPNKQPTEQSDTTLQGQVSVPVKDKKHSFPLVIDAKQEIMPIENTTAVDFGSADDMEGKESIGLINAHSDRNFETVDNYKFVGGLDSIAEVTMETKKRLDDKEYITFTTESSTSTMESRIENITQPDESENRDQASNVSEIGDGETIISGMVNSRATSSTKNLNEFTTHRYPEGLNDNTRMIEQYKTQNIHNLSGFKMSTQESESAKIITSGLNMNNVKSPIQSNLYSDTTNDSDSSNQYEEPITNERKQIISLILNDIVQHQKKLHQNSSSLEETVDLTLNRFNNQPIIQEPPEMIFKAPSGSDDKDSAVINDHGYEQEPDFQKYTVNYHTHYFPDTLFQHQDDENKKTASHVPNSENKIIIAHNHGEEQVVNSYYNNVEDKDNADFKNFGIRTSKTTKNSERFPIITRNTGISRNAHRINSELQGNPLNLLWTMSQAIGNIETLPDSYERNNNNLGSMNSKQSITDESLNVEAPSTDYTIYTVQSSTPLANDTSTYDEKYFRNLGGLNDQADSKTTGNTEFIPSLSFDFSNDEEKRTYYENLHQDVSPQLGQEESNVTPDFSEDANAPK